MSRSEAGAAAQVPLEPRLRELAGELGFAAVGFAEACALEPEGEQLRAWIAAGRHGTMDYMARTAEVRADPRHEGMLPGARSVIVVAAPHGRAEAPLDLRPGRIARYAQGRDYHNVLHKRLRKISALLRAEGHRARVSVDTLPVMERAWAARAGLGFIGKNCALIIPGLGSHVFLGAIVTDAELPPAEPMASRCGRCTACLDACPTSAFVGPRQLDARRCISYLTIEHRGAIEAEQSAETGDWLFGCDACQDPCPFNRTSPPPPAATAAFAPAARFEGLSAEDLMGMDDEAHLGFAQGSPLRRTGRAGLARNAALVLGNAGQRRSLPVLREAAERDPDAGVREAARTALARIERE
ncbi:MAG: tRNA epoxyqueuosine(34) reductase QueG [Myxococcales bacterium]|nr:tRNA epoxyqueuosine(34) reductase QueG [Myxococcales bacterium]